MLLYNICPNTFNRAGTGPLLMLEWVSRNCNINNVHATSNGQISTLFVNNFITYLLYL